MSMFKETKSSDYKPSDPNKTFLETFGKVEPPSTPLEVYRLLSPTSGVRVSPLCLGAMSLGDQWTGMMGGRSTTREEAFAMLDTFFDAGGNFIDTANNYQDEQSEHLIGEWMEERRNRNDIVLATKYTSPYTGRQGRARPGINVNYCGNQKKSLRVSLEDSLRKLRTDYIDILYVHWWDHSTSIPELMQSLNDVVRAGKVLYLGISDTPAWIVATANEYARAHGMAQFVVYQGRWNLGQREMERDIIPMARANGMAIAPWSVLGGGRFKSPEELAERSQTRGGPPSEKEMETARTLQSIAKELNDADPNLNATITGVALAWARAKVAYCFPVVGGTSPKHLKENIAALNISLSPKQVAALDAAQPFDPGFPTADFGTDPHYLPDGKPDGFFLNLNANLKFVEYP